jgi:chromate transporter
MPAAEEEALPRPRSPAELFLGFAELAVQGFGGVLPVAQRVLCEQRRWLTRAEFVELLAVCQALPGPNMSNVAVMLGTRHFGWRGALAALAGLYAAPLAIVLSATALYTRFAADPRVAGALAGMGAVSAGLITGTALRLSGALRESPMGAPASAAAALGAFALAALLHAPLWAVLAGPGLLAFALARRRLSRGRGGPP